MISEGVQSVRHGARHRGTQRRHGAAGLEPEGSGPGRHVSDVTGCEEACIKVLWAHRGRVTHDPKELWVVQFDRLPESPFLDIPS